MTVELSVVIPCLNEEASLAECIHSAQSSIAAHNISAEIIIADNGSTDGSVQIAHDCDVKVIHVKNKGYGSALMGGISAAIGEYTLMGDADCSYDFHEIPNFLKKLRGGADLVMGCRLPIGGGKIKPGAMPFLHRWLGNPVLSFLGKLFFRIPADDFHCGLRAFKTHAIRNLDLKTTGMEFASEMLIKAALNELKIEQIPVTLDKDKRPRKPHLRTWPDGWRHLRFMLLLSPAWIFLVPGCILTALGLVLGAWLLPGPQRVGQITFDIHTLLFSGLFIFMGFQMLLFFLYTKAFTKVSGLIQPGKVTEKITSFFSLERGILLGSGLFLIGCVGATSAVLIWKSESFGPLDPSTILRILIPSILSVMIGFQTIFSSFFLGILKLERKPFENA